MDPDERDTIEEIYHEVWIDALKMQEMLDDYTEDFGVPYEELKELYESIRQTEILYKEFLLRHPKVRRKRRQTNKC